MARTMHGCSWTGSAPRRRPRRLSPGLERARAGAGIGRDLPIETLVLLSVAGAFGIALLAILGAAFFTVEQRTAVIVQRLGKFLREAGPGLHVKIPVIDRLVGRINLRVQQLDVKIETKTEDNVFVHMVVAVQYYVLPEKVYDAFYKLDDATRQITSFVFDVVRARVPKIELDDVFVKKDEIADIVKRELAQVMDGFGYGILKALVTDIEPDARVKESMNEINAAQRMRVAATEKGEADRILKVKAAEGEAQSKALQGRGIADQRQAIIGSDEKRQLSIGDNSKTTFSRSWTDRESIWPPKKSSTKAALASRWPRGSIRSPMP